MIRYFILSFFLFFTQNSFANPYWDPSKVPTDVDYHMLKQQVINVDKLKPVTNHEAVLVLRLQIDWNETNENYQLNKAILEPSGTPALLERSKHKPKWGSYVGVLKNKTGSVVYYDSIGTGKEYRKLARAINLRFPAPTEDMVFDLYAENPKSGLMEKVVQSEHIPVAQLKKEKVEDVEIRELSLASKTPSVRVNIYSEGYLATEQKVFWEHAAKAVQALKNEKFSGVENMSFYAVYHSSNKKLGPPVDLGFPVPEYDSFLGLYYPYWDKFGRWYNVVYPTREDKFRKGLASAPYDFAIVLVNNNEYWGVGNYMSFTAIPAASSVYFTYLLLHEFGHFFGLNEEYEGGGRTELEFAPDMLDPWSQNITFLRDTSYEKLKWNDLVNQHTQLPTPNSVWKPSPPVYGAYAGGYGDSPAAHAHSHKPGLSCVMESNKYFCDICSRAIKEVVQFEGGAISSS